MSVDGHDPSASQSMSGEADQLIGEVVDGRYRILEKLGEGGMGEVYAAEHVHIEKRLAIKLLRKEIVSNKEAVARFSQEARSASRIGHKNIIGIEDFGTHSDGRIYLAMELLDGLPLSDLIREHIPPPDRLLNILIQTGHGLAAAHKMGIIHRDMKPENVFVTDGDVPKLLDFGIAKVSGADGNNNLTRTGTIFGTPFYMAPEQALGQNVDHRADIYAMGVIMYEIFTGTVPFQGESFMGILTQHITAEPTKPSARAGENNRQIPPGIEPIIIKSMAKEVGDRYQSMDELIAALITVYRGLAGAGMSAYMSAHRPATGGASASHSVPAPTPMPMPMNTPTPPPSASVPVQHPYSVTPMPAGHTGPVSPGSGQHAPPSGVHPASPYSDSYALPAKRSKLPIVLALLVLFAAGGGIGYYVYSQSQSKAATADDDAGAVVAGDGDGDARGSAGAGAGTGSAVAATPDAGTIVKVNTTPDAAPVVVTPDAAPAVPKVTEIEVTINANVKATVKRGRKTLGTTPLTIKVDPTKRAFKLTLSRKGYRSSKVTVNGKKPTVRGVLKERKVTGGGNGSGSGSGSGSGKPKCDPTSGDIGCLE